MSADLSIARSSVREVSVRYSGQSRIVKVKGPEDVWRFFLSIVGVGATKEHFLALFLDGRHQACGKLSRKGKQDRRHWHKHNEHGKEVPLLHCSGPPNSFPQALPSNRCQAYSATGCVACQPLMNAT